jgi:hypothetical protein
VSYVRPCASSRTLRGQRDTRRGRGLYYPLPRPPRLRARAARAAARLCVNLSNTGHRVRPTGSASPRAPRYGQLAGRSVFNTPYLFFTISFRHGCLGVLRLWSPCLSTLAARPSRRAGRPKPRHAKVGAAMPAEFGQHSLVGGVKDRNVRASGQTGSVSRPRLSSGPQGTRPQNVAPRGIRRPGTVWALAGQPGLRLFDT